MELVELRRDCQATLVPSGRPALIPAGEEVTIVQQLGGSFTVRTADWMLARIDGADADALGLEPLPAGGEAPDAGGEAGGAGGAAAASSGMPPFDAEQVIEQLRTIYDPEIPVNVVDLGLVYRCDVTDLGGGRNRVEIDMSMTAPGCGMGDILRQEAIAKVLGVPGVAEVEVELVWDPPWDMSRLSEEARLELGLW